MLSPEDEFIIDAVAHPYNNHPDNYADVASASTISELADLLAGREQLLHGDQEAGEPLQIPESQFTSRRSGASTTGSGSSMPPTWSTTAASDKDADAGTTLFR